MRGSSAAGADEATLVDGIAAADVRDRRGERVEARLAERARCEEVGGEARAVDEERARIDDRPRAESGAEVLVLVEVADEHAPEPGRRVLGPDRPDVVTDVRLSLRLAHEAARDQVRAVVGHALREEACERGSRGAAAREVGEVRARRVADRGRGGG